MNFKSLTNQKPVKNSKEEVVAMPPSNSNTTSGSFKLSDKAADKIGVTKGDYLDIAQDVETKKFYVGKGFKGTTVGEGDNAVVKGINGSRLGRSGSSLTLSAAKAWGDLGSETEKVHYAIGEGVEQEMPYGKRTYFELIETDRVERVARKSSAKSAEPAAANTAATPADAPGAAPVIAPGAQEESIEEADEFSEL